MRLRLGIKSYDYKWAVKDEKFGIQVFNPRVSRNILVQALKNISDGLMTREQMMQMAQKSLSGAAGPGMPA